MREQAEVKITWCDWSMQRSGLSHGGNIFLIRSRRIIRLFVARAAFKAAFRQLSLCVYVCTRMRAVPVLDALKCFCPLLVCVCMCV